MVSDVDDDAMSPRVGTLRTAEQLRLAFGLDVFSTQDAESAGVTRSRLSQAVAAGRIVRLRPDSYIANQGADEGLTRFQRVQEFAREIQSLGLVVAAGNETAAAIWGLPSPQFVAPEVTPTHVTVLVTHAKGLKFGRRPGLRVRRIFQLPSHHVVIGPSGEPVTCPLRTGIDLARGFSPERAVIPLSAAVRLVIAQRETGRVSPLHEFDSGEVTEMVRDSRLRDCVLAELAARIADLPGSRGIRSVAVALRIVEPFVESPLEALSWGKILRSALRPPTPQAWIRTDTGRHVRVDFLWDEEQVVGEADGLSKYSTAEALRAEKMRQEDLEAGGFQVVRWTLADMSVSPERTIERISQALSRRRHLP
jgi:very-short-patch-repair endonuclease